jgi:hypothetical protein
MKELSRNGNSRLTIITIITIITIQRTPVRTAAAVQRALPC